MTLTLEKIKEAIGTLDVDSLRALKLEVESELEKKSELCRIRMWIGKSALSSSKQAKQYFFTRDKSGKEVFITDMYNYSVIDTNHAKYLDDEKLCEFLIPEGVKIKRVYSYPYGDKKIVKIAFFETKKGGNLNARLKGEAVKIEAEEYYKG